jgi:hypothetical protein
VRCEPLVDEFLGLLLGDPERRRERKRRRSVVDRVDADLGELAAGISLPPNTTRISLLHFQYVDLEADLGR